MTAEELLHALGLPEATRLDQRVPKKLLAEHGAATTADRRLVQDGIDDLTWLAALKPHLIGVQAYRDEHRHYLEIAVLGLKLRPGVKPGRLAELLHRAVPYPVLLLSSADSGLTLSAAHLRTARNETERMVIDGALRRIELPCAPLTREFGSAMALARQPQSDLLQLYQGWMDTMAALDVALETGVFRVAGAREQTMCRLEALQRFRALGQHIEQLRAQARKETQLARQVAMNLELRELTAQRQALQSELE